MKKIIYFLGILFLSIILILNILFTAYLDIDETITISFNNFFYIAGLLFSTFFIIFITKKVNLFLHKENMSKKIKFFALSFLVLFYVAFLFLWTILVNPLIVGDQLHACSLAKAIKQKNVEQFLLDESYAKIPIANYLKAYPQQITLGFIYSLFFKLLSFDIIEFLRIFNVLSIVLIIVALYKITKHIGKKYQLNMTLMFILILTFLSLPMLSTFVYGDIPSICLSLFSIYFMMKYVDTRNINYVIFSSILMMVSYMMRMNSLIFIIATVIYLVLNLIKDFKFDKTLCLNLFIILFYISVSIIPSSLIENYFIKKYNLTSIPSYPRISYFLMGMEESRRGNGWYNEAISESALNNPLEAKNQYLQKIKDRLIYFSKNIGYTFNFYIMKIDSMWTENTYSAVRNNDVSYISFENIVKPLTFYQKTLLIVISLSSLIFLIKNRNNISLDIIFLLTIFIGGFAFHLLWEAKSRYIIPYIIVLIPIASICNKTLKRK